MDMKELWEKACELLKTEMNPVSYKTWIGDNLTPVALEGDTLVLRITIENLKQMVMNHYLPRISDSLTRVAGRKIDAEVLTAAELKSRAADTSAAAAKPLGGSAVQLNPKYTFDTFVVGSGNRFAHAASLAVAEAPAEAYNPLFIYGGVGLGKTHLMHAIGHHVQQQYPDKTLLYTTSESFTNELIAAIQNKSNQEFRYRFRNVDILMVDDIQFIGGKDATQEEFFHTFNALYTAGKQIILTSDRPPQDIALLEERLRSRFASGLIADVKKPDVETRMAILREKARRERIDVSDDILQLIADRVDSNIRELEGSLTRLAAYASLAGKEISMELCREALHETLEPPKKRMITAEMIMQTVCGYYGLQVEDMIRPTRRREITVPRQVAMFLTRELTNMSLPQIGKVFGNRDHTTVLYACNQIESGIKMNASTANNVRDIRNLITEGK